MRISRQESSTVGTLDLGVQFGLCLILLLLATSACASSETQSVHTQVDTLPGGVLSVRSDRPRWKDSSEGWSVVEEVRYGGEEGSAGELLDPQSFAADDAGRLYVVDSKPAVVKVYSSDGSFLRTMGREGSGPGEFRVGYIATRRDRVVIHDPREGRTSVFDSSGGFIRSAVTFCCHHSHDVAIDTAMRIVIPAFLSGDDDSRHTGRPFARYQMDLTPIDTFWVPGTSAERVWTFLSREPDGRQLARMSTMIPFTPRVEQALHPWGGVVRGVSDAYRLVRAPNGSDSIWIASRAWTPQPLPEALRQEAVSNAVKLATSAVGEARARQVAQLDDVPTSAPAFTSLSVDEEGNVWVRQLLGSDSTQTTFDVLDAQGAWSGTVRLPYSFNEYGGAYFGRGVIYLRTETDDGRPVIVRLRVRRGWS